MILPPSTTSMASISSTTIRQAEFLLGDYLDKLTWVEKSVTIDMNIIPPMALPFAQTQYISTSSLQLHKMKTMKTSQFTPFTKSRDFSSAPFWTQSRRSKHTLSCSQSWYALCLGNIFQWIRKDSNNPTTLCLARTFSGHP